MFQTSMYVMFVGGYLRNRTSQGEGGCIEKVRFVPDLLPTSVESWARSGYAIPFLLCLYHTLHLDSTTGLFSVLDTVW